MARTDAIVLGGGIVGTSVAVHLAKRGLSVALVERAGLGEQTSFGNAGIIEGNTVFPPAFPSDLGALARIAARRATEANYHLTFLPKVLPWLLAFRAASQPERLLETAHLIRPLFASAVPEHEALLAEAGAAQYLRKTGWLKVFRRETAFAGLEREFDLAAEMGLPLKRLDTAGAQALEPSLMPVFAHAVFWPEAASVSNPFRVTLAYASLLRRLGGVTLSGDARTLHRKGQGWRVETDQGGVDAPEVVIALGPWAGEFLAGLGLRLPFAVKRGYHRHFRGQGNAGLARPVLDADVGYCITPMEMGIRMTTGVEFAARDAPPTPVQFDRIMPRARELFPLGERTDATSGDKASADKTSDNKTSDDKTWMGSRPCFPDSRPVIGRAPGKGTGLGGLWLAIGHAHWGLTLGPSTGRMLAEMMTDKTPFIDPAPYRAERFLT